MLAQKHGKIMTMTSAQPGGRFGALNVDTSNRVIDFREKPQGEESWINAGYFICEPEVFNYIGDDDEDLIFKHFSDAEIETIADVGHWLHAEKPQEFFEMTVRFCL